LPPLSIGFHTVDIAATVDGASVQSGRSNRLLLLVVRPIQERSIRSARADAASTILTNDDVRLSVTPIVTGLDDPIDLAFMPEITRWNGFDRIQLRIRDLRPCRPT